MNRRASAPRVCELYFSVFCSQLAGLFEMRGRAHFDLVVGAFTDMELIPAAIQRLLANSEKIAVFLPVADGNDRRRPARFGDYRRPPAPCRRSDQPVEPKHSLHRCKAAYRLSTRRLPASGRSTRTISPLPFLPVGAGTIIRRASNAGLSNFCPFYRDFAWKRFAASQCSWLRHFESLRALDGDGRER